MNYIVFDLEWNQSAYGRSGEHPRMPFEIIEIGAVKVNEKFEIVSEYSSLIKPKIYKKLHNSIRSMLNYGEEELKKGKPFAVACKEFLDWCGDDYIFCTWGASDLYYLQSNMDFYYMDKLEFPLKFYNLQQIFADLYCEDNTICKLKTAVEMLKLEIDEPFHAAINDARYTARVMAAIRPKDLEERYTYDIYRHPKKKEEEIIAFHAGCMEQISGEFRNKREAMEDKDLVLIRCPKCKKKTSRKIKWFQSSQTTSLAIGKCWHHGYALARMKFKPAGGSDDNVFVMKKVVLTDKKGYEDVRKKQDDLREKRKQKRHEKRDGMNEN
jgi:inhibitor of KinA sporulation pathway (predicted exonuclease)